MGSEERERLAEEKADRFAELQRYAFIAGFMDGGEEQPQSQKESHSWQERYNGLERGLAEIMLTVQPHLGEATSQGAWYVPAAVKCAVATLKGQVQAAVQHGDLRASELVETINELHRAIEIQDAARKQAQLHLSSLENSRDVSNEQWDQAWQLLVKLPGTPAEGDFVTEFRKVVIRFQDWRDELREKWEAHGWEFLTQIVPNLDRNQDFFDAMQTVVKEVEGWEEDRIALRRAAEPNANLGHCLRISKQELDTYAEEIDSALRLLEPAPAYDHSHLSRGYWLNEAVKGRLHEIHVLRSDLSKMTAKAEEKQQAVLGLRDILDDRNAADDRIRTLCRELARMQDPKESVETVVEFALRALLNRHGATMCTGPDCGKPNDVPPERCIMAANGRVGGTHSREHRATATCNSIGCEPAARSGACANLKPE